MSDIVKRLNKVAVAAWANGWMKGEAQQVVAEAADEIESLTAERDRYRDALAKIAPDARQYKGTVYQVCRTCDGRSLAVDFDEIVHADDCVWERARRIVMMARIFGEFFGE